MVYYLTIWKKIRISKKYTVLIKLAYDSLLCGLDKNKLEYKKNELTATRSIEKGEVKDKQYKKLIFGID